jgi:hypothetical protein
MQPEGPLMAQTAGAQGTSALLWYPSRRSLAQFASIARDHPKSQACHTHKRTDRHRTLVSRCSDGPIRVEKSTERSQRSVPLKMCAHMG